METLICSRPVERNYAKPSQAIRDTFNNPDEAL